MKRKLLFVLLFTISAVACAIGLAACGDGNSDEHNLTHFVAVDATCTEDGNVEYWYCSDCGKYFSDAEATIEVSRSDIIIPAKGHTYGEWKTIKEATCTEDGERSKECVVCHHVETEVITVTGHSFSDWKDITPATCTTDGEQTRTCTKCQYKETATVYALGHDIQNNVCTRCGATATEGLRFKYVQGDGIDGVFCIGWDEEHAEGHGYSHNETEYGTLDLIIPDVYEGYPVIGVSQEWAYSFLGDLCIRSVTLPDSVIYIGDQTFQDCNYLQSVSVGPYLDYLGSGAFEDTALENTTANYENGLLYLISRDRETKWLVKAQEGLTDAVLDEDTMFVAADAFSYCDDTLSSLTFGTKIPCFYDDTFSVFNSLKNVYYNGTLEDWIKIEFYSDSANPLNNGVNLYLNGTLLTELITPTGMTEISNQFIGCISLEKVTVSEGVTEIGNMAFSGCTNLSALNLPDSLKTIGYDAFSDCTSLTSVTLPKSLESIGKDVFRGCKQLSAIQLDSSNTSFAVRDGVLYNTDFTELVYIPEGFSGILQLPDGVDLSNYNAIEYFERCENLTGIEVSENHLYHKSYNGIVYSEPDEYGSQFMYVAPGISGKIVLPDDIVIVSGFSGMDYTASGYAGRDITEIIFGANTKVIEYNAFTNCTQLVNVVIPDTVTSIGAGAFMGCTNLKSVVIGNEVVEIGYYAFKDCPLESVIFKHYTGWTVRGEDVTEEQLRNPETAAGHIRKVSGPASSHSRIHRCREPCDMPPAFPYTLHPANAG